MGPRNDYAPTMGPRNDYPPTMRPGKLRALLGCGIFLCCLLSGCTEARLRIINLPPKVNAVLGEDVAVPCVLTDDENPQLDLDLSIASVRWDIKSLNGSVLPVYLQINHKATPYRAGSEVETSEFKRGNASLVMRNVQIRDEGEYTCTVFVTPNKMTARIILNVLAKPSVRLTYSEVTLEPGHERSVVCEVTRFYPKSIMIHWIKYRRDSAKRSHLEREICFAENNDGTFNASSHMLVKPSSTEEDGDIYSCVVIHGSFISDQTRNFTLNVEEKIPTSWTITIALSVWFLVAIIAVILFITFKKASPKLSKITGAESLVHQKMSTLTCMISRFKPKIITVKLYVKRNGDSDRHLICLQKYPPTEKTLKYNKMYQRAEVQSSIEDSSVEPDTLLAEIQTLKPKWSILSYDCLCVVHVTPDIKKDDGAELTLEVEHPALTSPKSESCELNISGDFLMLSTIKAPSVLTHGKEVTLSCRMTTFKKETLCVSWLKKDLKEQNFTEIIYEEGRASSRYLHMMEEQEERLYHHSSSLRFKGEAKEDHEKEYICLVYCPKTNIMKKSELRTYIRAEPVLKPITSRHAVHHAGQQMELTCRIQSFHPREIEITWSTESGVLLHSDTEVLVDDDALFNATSVLNYIPKKEDTGRTFRCTVDHQSFVNPKTLEWTLKD